MNVDIVEQSDNRMRFILDGADNAFANLLRRTLLTDIPKMAIEDVDFHLGPISDEERREYESVSPIFDEMVAHRLGLLPVPTDLKAYEFRQKCKCGGEGCPTCTIMYSLKKMGPCTVYSRDLEPVSGGEKLKIADDNIPIVKLGKGQALLIYATAQLGTGKEHAKWSVTHGVGYKNYPVVEIDGKKCDKKGGCVKACPKKILKMDGKKGVVVQDLEKCSLCKACEEFCSESRAIKVSHEPGRFIFQLETDGSVKAKDALKYAISALSEKYDDLEKSLAKMDD